MSHFKSWESTPQYAAAKKAVTDVTSRLVSAKADLIRLKPKLGAFKKETLERLVKETQAKLVAAEKLKAASASTPEGAYLREINTELDKAVKLLMKDINVEVEKVKKEHKVEADAAQAYLTKGEGHGGSFKVAIALCEEYKALIKALQDEAKRAAKEGTIQERTI